MTGLIRECVELGWIIFFLSLCSCILFTEEPSVSDFFPFKGKLTVLTFACTSKAHIKKKETHTGFH